MNSKKKLLILSFTDARSDPREYRQAALLRDEYVITVAGFGDPGLDGVAFVPIEHRPAASILGRMWRAGNLLLGNSGPFLQRFALKEPEVLHAQHFDAIIVHDAEPLPLGFSLAKGAPVIFDAHEYYPRMYEDLFWKIFHKPHLTKLCARYIPQCAGMVTVCSSIVRAYQETFGIVPEVMFNAPFRQDLAARSVASERIRLIHHGGASPDRQLEVMLDMMRFTDARFTLDMMLVGQEGYIRSLKERYMGQANIIWRDPVPMQDLSRVSNAYDLGVFLVPPSTFNLMHCLPNKFFEFIQARLAIAIGPSPEMAAVVKEHALGVIADDFTPQALAAKLNALTAKDIMRFKHNTDKAAAIYNAEESMKTLKTVLQRALAKGNA
jgi:hypothetical protein